MPELPTGTVTFLFTDLEGSTRLALQLAERWEAALVEHRGIVRAAIAQCSGSEIDSRGDELFVAFEQPGEGAEAAIIAQRAMAEYTWPEGAELRVRMGLHTGQAIYADGDYLGVDVHRAARICFAGHGGQILLSAAMHALLPEEADCRDLGTYRLRGLPDPERIYQLVAPGLPTEFPPLRSRSGEEVGGGLRVVLADDSLLLREGIARLLRESGFEIVGQSEDAEDLIRKVAETTPDVVVADIRMPPGHSDEGLRAAATIRREYPGTGVLLLSQYLELTYARELLADGAGGVGYLLKDRVSDITGFADAVRRIADGDVVLDPEIKI
jgi:class 3 adenylate cyclase/ActR/RegA family two-component response regulator